MSHGALPSLAADVLILGGGPAGSATALALLRRGIERVIVCDRPSRSPFAIGESASPGVGKALIRLGLSDDLASLGHLPYHANISLWGGPEPAIDDFLRRAEGHGFHLDRAAFDAWLRASAAQAGATLLSPAELVGIERLERGFRVELRHEGEPCIATAAIVVDATGRKAAVLRRLGVRRRQLDRLVALAVLAEPHPGADLSLRGTSLIEPFADGWWYAAGLPSGRVILTLMTDSDLGREGNLRDPDSYARALEATTIVQRAAALPREGFAVASFSAASQFAENAIGPGFLAVGDALCAFDPLTSSGISGALDDALAAAETIAAWLRAKSGAEAMQAARVYAQRMAATLGRYVEERRLWYARERRWQERVFWRRRLG